MINYLLLSDEELSNVIGGAEPIPGSAIILTNPGGSYKLGSGVIDVANYKGAKYVGILNGTAPMFGSGDPVSLTIVP